MTGKEHPTEISSLHLHSLDDTTVPVKGRKMWLTMEPLDYLKKFYRSADGITADPTVTQYDTPSGPVRIESSTDPKSGREATYITISNQGHHWFGGKGDEGSPINSTNVIWDFLQRHKASEDAVAISKSP
jgi:poly(3-hydroxybutyrate) depolymerase